MRDQVEDALNLPSGKYEVPLMIFDRLITPDGQLYYPVSEKPGAPWVPEVFGDAILVNGKLFPYLEVEPRKYRFRVLNASNGRFYHLAFQNGLSFHQIGTDQGLLPAPVAVKSLMLAPGERVDVVVDFSDNRGEQIVLKNDAFVVMQFRVSANKVADPSSLPAELRPVPRIAESDAVKTRLLTLDEYQNLVAEPVLMLLNGTYWHDAITEKPVLNSTEIWSFINPDRRYSSDSPARRALPDSRPPAVTSPGPTRPRSSFAFWGLACRRSPARPAGRTPFAPTPGW